MTTYLNYRTEDLPQPIPSAGVDRYHQEIELALVSDLRRRDNYEKFIQSKNSRNKSLDYLPIKLDIENVSRCNFKCVMCVVADWPKGRRAEDMSLEVFQRLIDEQYGLVEIKLQGIGEPLLQKDAYFEMIKYARSKHIWVRTTTNASLLHLNNNYEKLVDSGVNELQISIDACTENAFRTIRPGSVFSQIKRNCILINAYSKSKNKKITKMWTVVQKENVHQLEDIVRFSSELGFENHVFSLEMSDWGMESMRERNENNSVSNALSMDRIEGLIGIGASLGVRVAFWNPREKYSFASEATICPWPFERAYISSDSRVVPCCYIGNPDIYQIDALEDSMSFSDIWNGEAMQSFRQQHLSGQIPKICSGCYQDRKKNEQ